MFASVETDMPKRIYGVMASQLGIHEVVPSEDEHSQVVGPGKFLNTDPSPLLKSEDASPKILYLNEKYQTIAWLSL